MMFLLCFCFFVLFLFCSMNTSGDSLISSLYFVVCRCFFFLFFPTLFSVLLTFIIVLYCRAKRFFSVTLWINECGLKTMGPALKGCKKLKAVHMCNNKIRNIEHLENMPALEVLWLCNNKITSVDGLSGCPKLRVLWLGMLFCVFSFQKNNYFFCCFCFWFVRYLSTNQKDIFDIYTLSKFLHI